MSTYTVRRVNTHELQDAWRFTVDHADLKPPQRQPGWIEWQYAENPDGFDVRVCETDGRLVGMSGFIPCRLRIDGTFRTGAFSTNTVVHPEHRGHGLGRRIHEGRLQDYDWAFSSGQSPTNLAVYRRIGFIRCGRYRRLFVQSKPPAFRPRLRWLRQWYSWVFWKARRPRSMLNLRVEVNPQAPRLDDPCYTERFGEGSIGPVWNHDHLVWRYERHPYFQYAFASVFVSKRLIGLGVVRHTPTSVVLADLYGKHGDLPGVLRGLAGEFKGLITGRFVGRTLEEVFCQAGWATFRTANRLLGKSNDPALHEMLRDRCWCFLGGDSDSDR